MTELLSKLESTALQAGYNFAQAECFDGGQQVGLVVEQNGRKHAVRAKTGGSEEALVADLIGSLNEWYSKEAA